MDPEKAFEKFRFNLLHHLRTGKYPSRPFIYKCSSFYQIFVEPFETINFLDFNGNINDPDKYNYPLSPVFIEGFGSRLEEDEMQVIEKIFESIQARKVGLISTSRGNAYMIFNDPFDPLYNKKLSSHFSIFSNSPTGKEEHVPRFIINQLAPLTYAILPLGEAREVEVDLKTQLFSFGVPGMAFPTYAGIGDVFFFGSDGLEFGRKNVVEVYNSTVGDRFATDTRMSLNRNYDIKDVGHVFQRSNMKSLWIRLFQESPGLYLIKVSEERYGGYLKEIWSGFTGRFNFADEEWISLEGSTSRESLK